jgi:hypothetical protein
LTQQLREIITQRNCSCISAKSLTQLNHTALQHWSISTYAFLLQGQTPDTLVLLGDGCGEAAFRDALPLTVWSVRGWTGGWFKLQPLRSQLIVEQPAPVGCAETRRTQTQILLPTSRAQIRLRN